MNTRFWTKTQMLTGARPSVRYPEKAKDTTYLSESGDLYGWTDPRRRLPVTEENRMRGSVSQIGGLDGRWRHRSSRVNSPPNAFQLIASIEFTHRKRIRGSVSSTAHDDSAEESNKAYIEPCIDSDVQANIDADTAAVEATAAGEEDARVKVDTRIDREDEVKEEAESSHRGTVKIEVDIVIEPVVSEDTHVPTDDDGSREVV
ncbi:hypothetical protein Tco_0422696 [Tanacetum coccineum]